MSIPKKTSTKKSKGKKKGPNRAQRRAMDRNAGRFSEYEPLVENERAINPDTPYHPDYVFTNKVIEVQHFVKIGTNYGDHDMLLVRRWDAKRIVDHAKLAQHILAQLDGLENAVSFIMIPSKKQVELFRTEEERSVSDLYSIMQVWISADGMPAISAVHKEADDIDGLELQNGGNPIELTAEE